MFCEVMASTEMLKFRDSKAASGTQPAALPSSPKTAAVAPHPLSGIRQGHRTGVVWVFTIVPCYPSATAGRPVRPAHPSAIASAGLWLPSHAHRLFEFWPAGWIDGLRRLRGRCSGLAIRNGRGGILLFSITSPGGHSRRFLFAPYLDLKAVKIGRPSFLPDQPQAGSTLMRVHPMSALCHKQTLVSPKWSERRNRVDDFLCGHNGVGVVRDIDVERGVHHLV
jgi:hypothetical protein